MENSPPYIESSWIKPDTPFEIPLRPQTLEDFAGQETLCERLSVMVEAAKFRKETLGHCLFYGPPGLGKTTLAAILAKSMGSQLVTTSGPVIEKAGDLAGVLTNLKQGDVLFIDEIHRMSRTIEEYLYPAMEDFKLDLMIDAGPAARSVQVKLEPFTLVAATTQVGLISAPLRTRFAMTARLEYYSEKVLANILLRSARLIQLPIDKKAAFAIAKRSRGTPRIGNNLLRWVRDFAQIRSNGQVDEAIALQALSMLNIDDQGLDDMDKKFLKILIEYYDGGPTGIQTLAIALGEDPQTLAEVNEPYLILKGFLKRTPRGREATALAYQHLQIET